MLGGVTFNVLGARPITKGSFKAVVDRRSSRARALVLADTGHALKEWQEMVAWSATATRGIRQNYAAAGTPVAMTLEFTLRRPKRERHAHPVTRPDIDKLTRAILDALTGVAYADDGQVVELHLLKRYGDVEGVTVTVGQPEEPTCLTTDQ